MGSPDIRSSTRSVHTKDVVDPAPDVVASPRRSGSNDIGGVEGFRVDGPDGRIGVVTRESASTTGEPPDTIHVVTGLFIVRVVPIAASRDRAGRRRPAPGRHPVDGSPPAVPARRADAPPVPRVGRKRRSTFAEVVRLAHASAGDGVNSARERHGRDSDNRPDEGLRRRGTGSSTSTSTSGAARSSASSARTAPGKSTTMRLLLDLIKPTSGLGDAARARQPGRTASRSGAASASCPATSRSIRR